MKAVIQRVKRASVGVDGQITGEIGRGILVLLAVKESDSPNNAQTLAAKILNLRIFSDQEGKMNLSLLKIKGEILIVSQFTLYGDCSKGRRPSFIHAAPPKAARILYEEFVRQIKKSGLKTETGKFRTYMEVNLVNDGPVTLILEN
jgi:D-tyrosyl-tRNA(Tyr) deacylase